MTYLYHLTFWGEICNESTIEKETGINAKDFWFKEKTQRDELKGYLKEIAKTNNKTMIISENEGENVDKRTIAKMVFVTPNGNRYAYEHDFEYGYPEMSARFMFEEGNYSCDCNKSTFIQEAGYDIESYDCGGLIKIENFEIVLE